MAYVVTAPCIGVSGGACVEVCCVEAPFTTPGADQHFIDPDACTDCGACMVACPVGAIYPADEVPEQWTGFTELNASKARER